MSKNKKYYEQLFTNIHIFVLKESNHLTMAQYLYSCEAFNTKNHLYSPVNEFPENYYSISNGLKKLFIACTRLVSTYLMKEEILL
jgi:hypothetical protein